MALSLSDYDVEGVSGEGGFALVQRCKHRLTGEKIAVKKLKAETKEDDECQARLRREIELLERLEGTPGVIALLGHSGASNDANIWYAMPLAETNLHQYVRRNNNKIEDADRVTLFRQVLLAIQSAHDQGILHRDISPSNALLLDRANLDSVVVSDFGLGRDITSEAEFTRSSAANYGHAYYVSPEQRDKLKSASAKSDIYSLGKLLNFIMTGKDPDHHHPCLYSPVIQRATDPDPEKRHPTVAHLVEQFDQMVTLRTAPLQRTTIGALDIGDAAPDWNRIHDALVNPVYDGHPYYDYLNPIMTFFAEPDRLHDYFAAVAGGSTQFAESFADELNKCFGTVRWPFSATGSFANFLRDIYMETEDSHARGLCLKEIWDIAFGGDQWDAQRTMVALLTSGQIGDNEGMVLASHILEKNTQVKDERLMKPEIPVVIRNALAQKQG